MNKNYKLGYQHAFEGTGYAPCELFSDEMIEEYNEGYNMGEMKRNEFQDYMQNNNEEYNEWN
jgi:hypothetical protein